MILKTYMKLYQNEFTTLDKYTRLPKPEIAIQISDWLCDHDLKQFKDGRLQESSEHRMFLKDFSW